MKKHEIVTFDWKADPSEVIELFSKALKKLGISVTHLPTFDGSDSYGVVLSQGKLSAKELSDVDAELH